MTIQVSKNERLNLRLSGDALTELRRAAQNNQQDLTSFVLGAALEKARREAFFSQPLELSETDLAGLLKIMNDDSPPPQKLIELMSKYASRK